jgi:hypothetical protein
MLFLQILAAMGASERLDFQITFLLTVCQVVNLDYVNVYLKLIHDHMVKFQQATHRLAKTWLLLMPPFFEKLSCPVCVMNSPIHGVGVFATRDVEKNEILTFYPAHGVAIAKNNGTCDEHQWAPRYLQRFGDENVESYVTCIDYCLRMDPSGLTIFAHPDFRDDTQYLGHLINDGCISPFDIDEKNYNEQAYYPRNNCRLVSGDNGLFYAVVARERIKSGSELFAAYGYHFWKGMQKRRQ